MKADKALSLIVGKYFRNAVYWLPARCLAYILGSALTSRTALAWDIPNIEIIEKQLSAVSSSYIPRVRLKEAIARLLVNWNSRRDPPDNLVLLLRLAGRLEVTAALSSVFKLVSSGELLSLDCRQENLHRRALRTLMSLAKLCPPQERDVFVRVFLNNFDILIGVPPKAYFAAVCWRGLYELGENTVRLLPRLIDHYIAGRLPEKLDWIVNNFARKIQPVRHCEMLREVWKDSSRDQKEQYLHTLHTLGYFVFLGRDGCLLILDLHRPNLIPGFILMDFSDPNEVSEDFLEGIYRVTLTTSKNIGRDLLEILLPQVDSVADHLEKCAILSVEED